MLGIINFSPKLTLTLSYFNRYHCFRLNILSIYGTFSTSVIYTVWRLLGQCSLIFQNFSQKLTDNFPGNALEMIFFRQVMIPSFSNTVLLFHSYLSNVIRILLPFTHDSPDPSYMWLMTHLVFQFSGNKKHVGNNSS